MLVASREIPDLVQNESIESLENTTPSTPESQSADQTIMLKIRFVSKDLWQDLTLPYNSAISEVKSLCLVKNKIENNIHTQSHPRNPTYYNVVYLQLVNRKALVLETLRWRNGMSDIWYLFDSKSLQLFHNSSLESQPFVLEDAQSDLCISRVSFPSPVGKASRIRLEDFQEPRFR